MRLCSGPGCGIHATGADPSTGATLASLSLPAGNLFAGVYAYMDQEDRVVLFNAEGDLLRIGHHDSDGSWTLSIDSSTPAAAAIDKRCASASASVCGGVVGIAPDWEGRVWFVTADGVAGYVQPETGAVKTIALGSGEQVANSISTAPEGTAIATDHALYLLTAKRKGPKILWRYAYERGPARKPRPAQSRHRLDPRLLRPRGRNPIPHHPRQAPFTGGVERIDLDQDGSGCEPRWQDEVRSAAVPRLDVANGILYTVQDTDPLEPDGTGYSDLYSEDAIDAATGQVLQQTPLGVGYLFNTLQLSPTIVPGEVMYQGTISGILRITQAHLAQT
jgi:hypothetical protein